jgi:hypothetical protein
MKLKIKKYIPLLLLFAGVVLCDSAAFSQCAMCKTTAESDLTNGGSIANGLNTGILYLMAIPYLVLMTGGYFFFRKQVDAKVKMLWNKYFPSKQPR